MKLKEEKGMTVIALIIIILIIIAVVILGVYFAKYAVNKIEIEDIKTDMTSIKTKAKIVAEEYNFKDLKNLVGTKLDQDDKQEGIQNETYVIPEELKTALEEKNEKGKTKIDLSKLYIWTEEDLNNQGLSSIKVNNEQYYIVYYNLKETNQCEIYYSQGYQGQYDLTTLSNL